MAAPGDAAKVPPEPQLDALRAAEAEGLIYTSDCEPGIRRVRRGGGFAYLNADGTRVTDRTLLARIRSLAIPPAYTDVWICVNPHGHLQATGRDARGRKQYRYHARWRSHRDAQKFDHVLEFGRALPRIRRRVAQDLRKPGLPRERVLATVVKLLESTLVRVGNEEYARANGSFGLTTLRDRHVSVAGNTLHFEFRGKRGIVHRVTVNDPKLSRIVRRCTDLPGQELFQWIDAEGGRHRIDSTDVNDYLRETSGGPFTAKDYRTWFATLEALERLRKCRVGTRREVKRQLSQVVSLVADRLGNTPAICRKCYIHPHVLKAYAENRLAQLNGASPAAALRALLRGRKVSAQSEALGNGGAKHPRRARSGNGLDKHPGNRRSPVRGTDFGNGRNQHPGSQRSGNRRYPLREPRFGNGRTQHLGRERAGAQRRTPPTLRSEPRRG